MKTNILFLCGLFVGGLGSQAQAPAISIQGNPQGAQISWSGGLLQSAAGQTIQVVFEVSSSDALTTIMLLDDVHVSNVGWK